MISTHISTLPILDIFEIEKFIERKSVNKNNFYTQMLYTNIHNFTCHYMNKWPRFLYGKQMLQQIHYKKYDI